MMSSKDHRLKMLLMYEEEINEETLLDNFSENANGLTEWTKSIYKSAEDITAKSVSGSVVNAFYNSQHAVKLKNLLTFVDRYHTLSLSL